MIRKTKELSEDEERNPGRISFEEEKEEGEGKRRRIIFVLLLLTAGLSFLIYLGKQASPKIEEITQPAVFRSSPAFSPSPSPVEKSKALELERILVGRQGVYGVYSLNLETKEAVECLDVVLDNPLLDEIHIGLNDLHLSYGLTFMFELLTNGIVEAICEKCKAKKVPYGFGGIARIGEGMLPAERIVMEHYRIGSTRAILSRSFCNADEIEDITYIEKIFSDNMKKLRDFELTLTNMDEAVFAENRQKVISCVNQIVATIKEKRK